MTNRFLAFLAAVLFTFSSVVTPARAFAPVAVLAAPQVVSAGAAYGVAALAGLIGLAGLYLEISDMDGNKARIPLKEGADAEPPAPSAAATNPGTQMPTYLYSVQSGYNCNVGSYSSPGELCTAARSCCANNASWQCQVGNSSETSCRLDWYNNGAYSGPAMTLPVSKVNGAPQVTCPSGYIKSGSSCVLSNPREAAPDKNCDLKFNASKYMYYNDADCPSGPTIDHSKAVPGLRSDGDVAFVPGRDSQGNPVLVKVLNQRDPSTGAVTQRVLEYYRQTGANVEKTTVAMNPQAVVQSVSTSTSPGQLTSPSTSPSASSTPDNATTTPQANTDPTKQPVVQFPDDYARENTAQRTATAVENLLKPETAPTDPSLPESSQFRDSFFKDTFSGLKQWRVPAHTSQCPTATFDYDLFGKHFHLVLDAHCTISEQIRSLLSAAMIVFWSITALFIILWA